MYILRITFLLSMSLILCAGANAGGEKDCLLQGTVHRGDQDNAMVKIHSVKKYDDESRCKVRRGEKMEFKLPADTRVREAPDGSEVKYRYRTDEQGNSSAELISVGA
jgi:hypothetical protein